MKQLNIGDYSEKNKVILKKIKAKIEELNLDSSELCEALDIDDEKVKIVFVGQFSAGKSSIIKMLTGEDVAIGAKITTQKSTVYQLLLAPSIDTQLIFVWLS